MDNTSSILGCIYSYTRKEVNKFVGRRGGLWGWFLLLFGSKPMYRSFGFLFTSCKFLFSFGHHSVIHSIARSKYKMFFPNETLWPNSITSSNDHTVDGWTFLHKILMPLRNFNLYSWIQNKSLHLDIKKKSHSCPL